jgi:diguanylate cyclase (GGDEF)-like protein/PAS domain S-box-containing protein
MRQYHEIKEQYDHQYSQHYQQYFALPIPCYSWQAVDNTLQLVDFNPAAARFSRETLQQDSVVIGLQPEKFFWGFPALYRHLVSTYQTKNSARYHLEFNHLGLYLRVEYVFIAPDQVLMFLENETEQVLKEEQLRMKARQQSAIAKLGQLSFDLEDLDKLLRQAVVFIARILDVPYSSVYKLQANTPSALLEAGYGWPVDLIGTVTVSTQPTGSHVGYTLEQQQPITIEDFRLENRFKSEPLLHNYGVLSALSIPIGSSTHYWGVLAIYSLDLRFFTKDEVYFLQAIANIIASAANRKHQTSQVNLLHRSIDAMSQGIVITNAKLPHNPIIYVNRGFEDITGYSKAEIIGKNCNFLQGRETKQPALEELRAAILKGQIHRTVLKNYRKNGDLFWNDLQIFPVRDHQGYLTHFIGIQTDITEQRATEDELYTAEDQFRQTFNLAPIGMAITDLQGRYREVNQAWCRILGYELPTLLQMNSLEVTYPEDREEDRLLNLQLSSGAIKQFQREKRFLAKDGRVIYVLIQAVLVHSSEGKPLHVIRQMVDISDRKTMEAKLVHDALYDNLTNLPNRSLLNERLQQAIRHHQRYPSYNFAVLFLDLDHFKWVNDSLGHQVGDLLLQAFAERVQECLRETDTLARLGGDEFVVLLDEIHRESYALQISERIHEVLQHPFALAGKEVFMEVSIGILQGVMDYKNPDEILRDADVAMYQAKSKGRARSEVFDLQLQSQLFNRRHLEQELREAIAQERLQMRYQPIIDLHQGTLAGIATKIYWEHPKDGWIEPDAFLAIAAETGLIMPLTRWSLIVVCQNLQKWQVTTKNTKLQLHYPIANRQLHDLFFAEFFPQLQGKYGIHPEQIVLEFSENNLGDADREIRQQLTQIRKLGAQVYLDGFGGNHLSLGSLYDQLVQGITVEPMLFKESFHHEEDPKAFLEAIVNLANSLNLEILVKDITTPTEWKVLRDLHCSFGQGQLFGDWQTSQEITTLLQHHWELPVVQG